MSHFRFFKCSFVVLFKTPFRKKYCWFPYHSTLQQSNPRLYSTMRSGAPRLLCNFLVVRMSCFTRYLVKMVTPERIATNTSFPPVFGEMLCVTGTSVRISAMMSVQHISCFINVFYSTRFFPYVRGVTIHKVRAPMKLQV